MEHYDRITASHGVFNMRTLSKVREAYTAIAKSLDPEQTSDEGKRAEIADALFYLAKEDPKLSAVELSINVIDQFSRSLAESDAISVQRR
jgi:hypothetical protein